MGNRTSVLFRCHAATAAWDTGVIATLSGSGPPDPSVYTSVAAYCASVRLPGSTHMSDLNCRLSRPVGPWIKRPTGTKEHVPGPKGGLT